MIFETGSVTMLEIQTTRLRIRRTDQSAVESISSLNTTDIMSEYLESLSPADLAVILLNKKKLTQLFDRLTNVLQSEDRDIYGAWLEERLIGYISLINASSGCPEMQIEIAPDCHHLGYGYEFMQGLLKQLFVEKNYEYIRYTVTPSNMASIALAEKIGAVLQIPECKAEELLMKTYFITREALK